MYVSSGTDAGETPHSTNSVVMGTSRTTSSDVDELSIASTTQPTSAGPLHFSLTFLISCYCLLKLLFNIVLTFMSQMQQNSIFDDVIIT